MTDRERVPESTFGSYADAKGKGTCLHVWIGWSALIYGYMEVDWYCVRCGTWAVTYERTRAMSIWRLHEDQAIS